MLIHHIYDFRKDEPVVQNIKQTTRDCVVNW